MKTNFRLPVKARYFLYTLLVVWATSCINAENKQEVEKETIEKKTVEIGNIYLHSYKWYSENPFEVIEIDTVIVLDLKGKYIKWRKLEHDSSFFLSARLNYFKQRIKPCN